MANEFKVKKGLIVQGSGSTGDNTILDVQGNQGQLFSITDSLEGTLFTVSDISGIPILDVNSNETVKIGTFGSEGLIVNGSNVTSSGNISASGQFVGADFGLDSTDKLQFSNGTLQFRLNDTSRITHTQTVFRPTSDEGVSLGRTAEKWKELVVNNITASGNISASGTITANAFVGDGSSLTSLPSQTDNNFTTTLKNKLDGIEASADVTDATNVAAAGALMDSEVTNLAQVKAFDSSDYATAAQGTTADNALPKSGGTMTGAIDFGNVTGRAITITGDNNVDSADVSIYLGNSPSSYGWDLTYKGTGSGNANSFDIISTNAGSSVTALSITQDGNISVSGTVDGRDIATDGTKLDGIESNADVTDATNVAAAGALMDSEVTDLAGIKGVTISTLQVKPSEGAFANGDKTKLDGIATGADVTPTWVPSVDPRYLTRTDLTRDVINALPVANGGTGATTAAGALTALGAASSSHTHAASDITSGTLDAARIPDDMDSGKVKQICVTHHGFALDTNNTDPNYFPLNNLNETRAGDTAQYYARMIAPYGGRVVKVMVRADADIGNSCSVVLTKLSTSGQNPDGLRDEGTDVQTISGVDCSAINTTHTFTFTSGTFSAGDVVNVGLQKNSTNTANVTAVVVWEYTL